MIAVTKRHPFVFAHAHYFLYLLQTKFIVDDILYFWPQALATCYNRPANFRISIAQGLGWLSLQLQLTFRRWYNCIYNNSSSVGSPRQLGVKMHRFDLDVFAVCVSASTPSENSLVVVSSLQIQHLIRT